MPIFCVLFSDPQYAFINDQKQGANKRISISKAAWLILRKWLKEKNMRWHREFKLVPDEEVTTEPIRHEIRINIPTGSAVELRKIAEKSSISIERLIWQVITEQASHKRFALEVRDRDGNPTRKLVK